MNNNLVFATIIFAAAVASVGVTIPSLSYAYDFGNETCIADASSLFLDGYHGAHEDYLTVVGMLKATSFPR
jgi:hypothetical protein